MNAEGLSDNNTGGPSETTPQAVGNNPGGRPKLLRRPLETSGCLSSAISGSAMDVNAVAIYRGIPVGRRIHVTGNSCSGKSTLASQLASTLDVPLVELDALNWQPGWVGLADYRSRGTGTAPRRRHGRGRMGRLRLLHGIFAAGMLAARGDGRLAGPARAPAALARAGAVVEALAVERAALGHQLRAVLAPVEGMEPGGLAGLVDRYAASQEAPAHAGLHAGSRLGAHRFCPTRIQRGDRSVLACRDADREWYAPLVRSVH